VEDLPSVQATTASLPKHTDCTLLKKQVLVGALPYFLYVIIMPLHTEHTCITNTRDKYHPLSGSQTCDPSCQAAAKPHITLQGHQSWLT
jgi:hypothetical protein